MAKLAIYWWHSRKGSFEVISPWWEWQGGGRGTLGACANWQPCSCCWRRWDPPDSTLTHLFMPSHPQSLAPTTKPILFTPTIIPNTPPTNLSYFKRFKLFMPVQIPKTTTPIISPHTLQHCFNVYKVVSKQILWSIYQLDFEAYFKHRYDIYLCEKE